MPKKFYIKVITGFREDQCVTIPMQEAHKAYYLFRNPEERGVFNNGVALVGKNIQEIKPDWNMTMGYLPEYELTDEDWNQLRGSGVETKMRQLIEKAKDCGDLVSENPKIMKMDMKDVIKLLPKQQEIYSEERKQLASKFKL